MSDKSLVSDLAEAVFVNSVVSEFITLKFYFIKTEQFCMRSNQLGKFLQFRRHALGAFSAFAVTVSMTGCLFGDSGSGGSVSSVGGGASTIANPTITLTNVYPTGSGSSWVASGVQTDGTGRVHIIGRSLSIVGTCSRGTGSVKVAVSGTYFAETAACDSVGNFTWNKQFSVGAESDYDLDVVPFLADGTAILSAKVSTKVRVDDSLPAAPVITVPSSSGSYSASGSVTITISGSCSADTIAMTGPGSTSVPCTGLAWTYDATLVPGATTVYNFYAFDRAGNQSPAGSISISYTPSLNLFVAGDIPGNARVIDSGTSYSMEASATMFPFFSSDSGTSFSMDLGKNRIINQVRSDP